MRNIEIESYYGKVLEKRMNKKENSPKKLSFVIVNKVIYLIFYIDTLPILINII